MLAAWVVEADSTDGAIMKAFSLGQESSHYCYVQVCRFDDAAHPAFLEGVRRYIDRPLTQFQLMCMSEYLESVDNASKQAK